MDCIRPTWVLHDNLHTAAKSHQEFTTVKNKSDSVTIWKDQNIVQYDPSMLHW